MGGEANATIISQKVICKQPGKYIGWPSIVRARDGELMAVFSGDRDAHVCPWGKTQMIRSRDAGETWTPVATVNNTPLDDRDAGILQTSRGTLLVSWFTSLAFANPNQVNWQKLPEATLLSWTRHTEKLGPETRRQWLGNWVRRSTDGGKTWEDPVNSIVSAPHGPIQLADGALLYVGVNRKVGGQDSPQPPAGQRLAAARSDDDGKTWKRIGYVPVPAHLKPGEEAFHEPHVAEIDGGQLVAMFRHHGDPGKYFLWQSESKDGGKTWSVAHQTGIWGYPPHLIRLSNNWLLVSYGRRKPPFSERACISRDGGKTWDTENEISLAPARNSDLGYPASVQLDDGSILTVYYQVDQPGEKTCLMATHWRLNDVKGPGE